MQMIAVEPKTAYARAKEYAEHSRFDDALALLNGILAADAADAHALRYRIELLGDAGRPKDALAAADAAVAVRPDDTEIRCARGRLHYEADRYPAAIADFEALLVRKPAHADALRYRAASLRLAHEYAEAERSIKAGLEHHPADTFLLRELGSLRFDQNQFDRAADAFHQAAEADRKDQSAASYEVEALSAAFRYDDAIAAANGVCERFPGSLSRNQLGILYLEVGRLDDAVRAFDDVLTGAPNDEGALAGKIAALRKSRNYPAAEHMLEEARRRVPGSIAIRNEQVNLHVDRRQYEDALAVLDEMLRIDDLNEAAHGSKIQLLRNRRCFAEAETAAQAALKACPESAQLFFEKARLCYDQRKFPEARAAYDRSLSLDPLYFIAIFGRIDLLNRLNHTTEALTVLQTLKSELPDAQYVLNKLGWQYLLRGDVEQARREFQGMIDSNAGAALGYNGLGGAAEKNDDYAEAELKFREVVARVPGRDIGYGNLAWALLRQDGSEKLEEATAVCEKALSLEPNNASAFQALGVIAFKRGRLRESEEYLLLSIEADPQRGASTDLGALYTRMGRYEEAEKMLAGMLDIDPYDTRTHLELGNLYLETERNATAIAELRRALAIDAGLPDASRALATALVRGKRFPEAETVLRDGIRRIDAAKAARLHLMLAEVLTQLGDAAEDGQYYEDAEKEATLALKAEPGLEDAHLARGIARFKSGDTSGALRDFNQCGERNVIAERNARRLKKLRADAIVNKYFGFPIAALVLVQMLLLGIGFWAGRIHETTLATLLPILTGLVVIAFVLPSLTKFKISGVEADLSQQKEGASSSGPTGPRDIALSGASPAAISAGPR